MERKDRIDALGGVFLLTFSMLLGLNQVLVKIVNTGFDPIFQAGLRSACAILPVLLYAWLRKKKLTVRDGSFGPGILCGIFFAAEFIFLFQSLEISSVARVSILFYTMPFWVTLAAHFLIPGEYLTKMRSLGIILAFLGVVIAIYQPSSDASAGSLQGDIYAILAAISWAGLLLVARLTKLNRAVPEMQLIYQLVVSAAVLLAISIFIDDVIRDVTPMILGILAFQVLVIVCTGYVVWLWVLTIYPASDMASFGFLAPVFGVFFGWFILDEAITPFIILSLILVSIGIVLVNRKPKPKAAKV